MTNLSRRHFFRRFTDSIADQLDLEKAKAALAKITGPETPNPNPKINSDWTVVGRLADFSPGIIREIKIGNQAITIRSFPEGLWAERDTSKRVALRTEGGGAILANIDIEWPLTRMLSHLTGDAIDTELQIKIRTTGDGK